ncbi:hypothetical protein [Actinoplanes sp. NPDC049118]|uniref:hypothetical protein n=1 Tax=Actinoplanes sp. NPDC049118 TaxID=3155769 RepID=UPI0033FD4B0A
MLMHPELMLALANDRHRELIAEADRERVLTAARAVRKARQARKAPVVRRQRTGTLASCEPSAAVPAR